MNVTRPSACVTRDVKHPWRVLHVPLPVRLLHSEQGHLKDFLGRPVLFVVVNDRVGLLCLVELCLVEGVLIGSRVGPVEYFPVVGFFLVTLVALVVGRDSA